MGDRREIEFFLAVIAPQTTPDFDTRPHERPERRLVDVRGEDHADLVDMGDLCEGRAVELGAVDQHHRLTRAPDHRPLDLRLERVRIGEEALVGEAADGEEHVVGEVRLDRPDRLGADERARQLPQRAAGADHLDLRCIELADELHDRHGVREQRAPEVLPHDAPRRDVRRRRAVDEHGPARLDEPQRFLGQALLRLDRDVKPLEERVLVAGQAGSTAPPWVRLAMPRRSSSSRSRRAVIGEMLNSSSRLDIETLPCCRRRWAIMPPPLVREHGSDLSQEVRAPQP